MPILSPICQLYSRKEMEMEMELKMESMIRDDNDILYEVMEVKEND